MHTYMISFKAVDYGLGRVDIYNLEFTTFPLDTGKCTPTIVNNPSIRHGKICFVNARDKYRAQKIFYKLLNEKYKFWWIYKGD